MLINDYDDIFDSDLEIDLSKEEVEEFDSETDEYIEFDKIGTNLLNKLAVANFVSYVLSERNELIIYLF